jgi:NADPH:quinone reductase-like Zn-dependent oxidoreductase
MRAAFMERFGPPDVIRYGELPPPQLRPGEVLVDVLVTAVNHVDTFVRSGAWRTPVPMPFIVGRDMVGTVSAVGAGTRGFAVGERVWCSSLGYAGRQGAAAEQVAVAAERLYRLPRGICPTDAVAVSHPASTAHLALYTHGRLRRGETVVVVGAGGNVGSVLVMMAAQAGAHVIAVASGHHAEHVRALGATEAVDHRSPGAWDRVRELAPHGVDLYVDTAAQNDLGTAVGLLARRGRIVLLSGMHTRPVLPVGPLYVKDCSVIGFAISQASHSELADAAAEINRLLAEGLLRPRATTSLPMSDAAEAHRRLEAGEVHGKLVLHTGDGAQPDGDLTNPASVLGQRRDAAGRLSRMTTSVIDKSPLFELRADIHVSATPDEIYGVVSDLPRSGEWSPECQGGEWTEGEPSAVGSVFRGENLRSEEVVAWAPLVRGVWHTEAKVTEARPGRTFRWMMLSHVGGDQESVWGFDIEPADGGGAVLTHHFRMGKATAGIHKIVADLDEDKRERFVDEWSAKLAQDLKDTLSRIKSVIEK